MQINRDFSPAGRPCAVALGLFDGVHLGHRRVIGAALNHPELESGVLTFDTSRQKPSRKAQAALIQPLEERLRRLESLGVAHCWAPDFSSICEMEPEVFVRELLFARMHAKLLCCGEDFRFGRRASGDVALLERLCREAGVTLTVVPEYLDGGAPVSSTRIREALEQGRMEEANRLLGEPYTVTGEVIHGRRLGTRMHYPTLNQRFDPAICQPRYGVYVSTLTLRGVRYAGITNIGVKPTLNGTLPLAETHVVGLAEELYGETVTVTLHRFVRGERRFANVDELFAQIAKDTQEAVRDFAVMKKS